MATKIVTKTSASHEFELMIDKLRKEGPGFDAELTPERLKETPPDLILKDLPPDRLRTMLSNFNLNAIHYRLDLWKAIKCLIPEVGAAQYHSIAKWKGQVWTWGYNHLGELGDGTTTDHAEPVQLSVMADIMAVAAGSSHTLALKSDGSVFAWGRNDHGQCGRQDTAESLSPDVVNGLGDVIAIAAGEYHTLALKSDGTVWSLGLNNDGQLGDGTTQDRNYPVQVSGIREVVGIAAGGSHSLALKSDGTVWFWGDNKAWQSGQATGSAIESSPIQVNSLGNIINISARYDVSLALTFKGRVFIWGSWGLLGPDRIPREIDLNDVREIAAGVNHMLALKSDGTVWSWGENSCGQIGDGTNESKRQPVRVVGVENIVSIAAGWDYSLACRNDSTTWAWGRNYSGNLGDGTRVNRSTPVKIRV